MIVVVVKRYAQVPIMLICIVRCKYFRFKTFFIRDHTNASAHFCFSFNHVRWCVLEWVLRVLSELSCFLEEDSVCYSSCRCTHRQTPSVWTLLRFGFCFLCTDYRGLHHRHYSVMINLNSWAIKSSTHHTFPMLFYLSVSWQTLNNHWLKFEVTICKTLLSAVPPSDSSLLLWTSGSCTWLSQSHRPALSYCTLLLTGILMCF